MPCRSPFSLFGLLLLAAPLFVTATAQIPAPSSVLGHTPGDDFYLANYEDAIKYFHAIRRQLRSHQDVYGGKEHTGPGH